MYSKKQQCKVIRYEIWRYSLFLRQNLFKKVGIKLRILITLKGLVRGTTRKSKKSLQYSFYFPSQLMPLTIRFKYVFAQKQCLRRTSASTPILAFNSKFSMAKINVPDNTSTASNWYLTAEPPPTHRQCMLSPKLFIMRAFTALDKEIFRSSLECWLGEASTRRYLSRRAIKFNAVFMWDFWGAWGLVCDERCN